jgi:hypothetical protein
MMVMAMTYDVCRLMMTQVGSNNGCHDDNVSMAVKTEEER